MEGHNFCHLAKFINEMQPNSSKGSPKFIPSRGFPLRYLARMEASSKKEPVMFVSKHDYSNETKVELEHVVQQGQAQLTYPPLGNENRNLMVEVSQFVYVFQEEVHRFLTQLCVLQSLFSILMHVKYCILRRKGSYFNSPVNGFV